MNYLNDVLANGAAMGMLALSCAVLVYAVAMRADRKACDEFSDYADQLVALSEMPAPTQWVSDEVLCNVLASVEAEDAVYTAFNLDVR